MGDGRVDLYAGFCSRCCHRWRPSISACRRRQALAAYPQARAGSPRTPAPASALRRGALLGLAPGGVYLATPVARGAGGLLPHRFTLTDAEAPAVYSLWHCPAGHPGLPLTTTLPCGVRTFLGGRFETRRRDRPVDSSVAGSIVVASSGRSAMRPRPGHRSGSGSAMVEPVTVTSGPPNTTPIMGNAEAVRLSSAASTSSGTEMPRRAVQSAWNAARRLHAEGGLHAYRTWSWVLPPSATKGGRTDGRAQVDETSSSGLVRAFSSRGSPSSAV